MKYKIEVINSENILTHTLEASDQKPLLDVFLKAKIQIDHTCGGHATCGTCRVFVLSGKLSPRTRLEIELYVDKGVTENERLSCQARPLSDVMVKIPG